LNQSINYTQITSSKKQIQDIKTNQAKELNHLQNSKKVDKYINNMTFIKKDMVKSLALTTFILALETLLYFVWR
jgi:threonyl-tRNA synthetase